MNQLSHDYSRHTVEELGNEVSTLEARVHPERAKALHHELYKRLGVAQETAEHAANERALEVGARFDQLDRSSRRRFFWPYLGLNAVFGIAYGFLMGFVAAFIAAIINAIREPNGADAHKLTLIVQLVLGLVLLVPVGTWWLRQITTRSFGGYWLRIVRKGE